MRHLLSLDDLPADDPEVLFRLADRHAAGDGPRHDGAAAMFFPPSSLRTRASFEVGAARIGLQPVVFPPESLDKPEARGDVAAYLANWVDVLVVRHQDPVVLEELAGRGPVGASLPVVNAMTAVDHPCEVLGDLWTLRADDPDWRGRRVVVVGADGNVVRAWAAAARVFGLDVVQVAPAALATPGLSHTDDLSAAMRSAEVVVTDPPGRHAEPMTPFRVTAALLDSAPAHVRLLPCPPFVRGRELTADALDHPAWVGHRGKRGLLPVQQAALSWVLGSDA